MHPSVPSPIVGVALLPLAQAAGATAFIYGFLIVALRVFGRRQTGQLTVIDLVVILLLGSAVETSMIHGDTTLLVGLTSAATLLLMNAVLARLFLRSRRLSQIVNGGPVLLIHDGQVVEEHLRRVGMTPDDLAEAVRDKGCATVAEVRSAVLETDGTVSVIEYPGPKNVGP